MAWEQEEGYRSFSLDDRPPSDTQLLEQHGQLSALRENNEPYDAVNFLLNRDIEAGRLLKLYSHSVVIRPTSTLKFHEKVCLLAKLRLLERELQITQAAKPMPNPAHESNLEDWFPIDTKGQYESYVVWKLHRWWNLICGQATRDKDVLQWPGHYGLRVTTHCPGAPLLPTKTYVNAIMCCCWPVEDVYVEENRAENRPREFVWNGSRWVEVVGRRCAASPRLSYSITITRITMGGATRSSDQKELKSNLKQSPSPHVHFSTGSNKHRSPSRDTARETTHSTEIPVNRPSATASGNQNNNTSTAAAPATTTTANSTYQTPGPGFDHIVTNVPGVGLVYNQTPINGSNPASGQQPHLQHQGPGLARPQVLPPGFVQAPTSPSPQFFPPVSRLSNPAMAYTSFMPNQGQHFQPPVPDTTYGAIPHTYTPRFDNPVPNGQYLTINGQIYRVVVNQTVQDGAAGGTPVQLVPLQQVSTIHTQGPSSVPPTFQTIPCYVVQQASSQPAYYPVNASLIRTLSEAPGVANAPILLQQGAPQQGVFIPAQTGLPGIAAPAPVAVQPGAFPAMVGQPQVLGAANMPGAWPAAAAPDVMGIGKTSAEIQMEQYHTALNTKALEGQDIAPADPDPSRMYYCRELDGEWTLRNRYGIDNMGDCRCFKVSPLDAAMNPSYATLFFPRGVLITGEYCLAPPLLHCNQSNREDRLSNTTP
ncbi:hypothetical protein K449DRAFT_420349 [Hypoxylon sp. EC38]|nr:hypothetical protein K449DRAFT_420349 [Hypoxylon sp. EC38]